MNSRTRTEDKAVAIIHRLIVQRRKELSPAFSIVHRLVPKKHPKLTIVKKVLQQERGAVGLVEQLKQLCELIQHKSEDVRLLALNELHGVLSENSRSIHQALLAHSDESPSGVLYTSPAASTSTNPNPNSAANRCSHNASICIVVSTLIGTLLWVNRVAGGSRGSSSSSSSPSSSSMSLAQSSKTSSSPKSQTQRTSLRIRLACGACLGELSAVDPSRLELERVQQAQSGLRVSRVLEGIRTASSVSASQFTMDLGNEEVCYVMLCCCCCWFVCLFVVVVGGGLFVVVVVSLFGLVWFGLFNVVVVVSLFGLVWFVCWFVCLLSFLFVCFFGAIPSNNVVILSF